MLEGTFELFVTDASVLFVEDVVFLHAYDDVLQGLGLHLGVLLLGLDLVHLLLLALDLNLEFLPLITEDLVLLSHELDLSLFEFHRIEFLPAQLAHIVVVLADRT